MAKNAKTKDGLPRRAFAYAPTADPATWKLPFLKADLSPDPDALPVAAAALTEADVPATFIPMVKSKLRQGYRRLQGAKVEYPAGIAEVQVAESDGDEPGVTIREAVVLLDKGSVTASVITVPGGDTIVIPQWTGAFDDLAKPYVPWTPQPSNWSSAMDAEQAAALLPTLIGMKRDEAGEPAQAALIDGAISNLSAFIKAETDEITADKARCDMCDHAMGCDCTTCSCIAHGVTTEADYARFVGHTIAEAGRRNSNRDLTLIQSIHDMTHRLGAEPKDHLAPNPHFMEAAVVIDPLAATSLVSFQESGQDGIINLAEADAQFDDATKQVWITPIAPGWGNRRDKNYYPTQTLREAAEGGLFNGLKMFRNHPRKSDKVELPERSVTDWFGVVKESTWDEVNQRPRALVQVFEDSDWNRFKAAPEQVAFSVLGQGKVREGTVGGQKANIIESFTTLRSVDWVTTAGAGGGIAFAESASDEEFDMDINALTVEQVKALKESNPAVFAVLVKGIAEAEPEPTPEPTPEPEPTPAPEPAIAAAAASDAAPVAEAKTPAQLREALIDELLADRETAKTEKARAAAIAEAQVVVKAVLKETTLPSVARDLIEADFAESGFGGGFIYTDEPAFRAAVGKKVTQTEALLKATRGYAPRATGLGAAAAQDGDGGSVREAVAANLTAKWGQDVIPQPDPTVAWTGKTPEDDGKPGKTGGVAEADKPKVANVSEAAQPVADRLAAKWGNGN